MNVVELTAAVTAAANAMAGGLNADQLYLLGSVLNQLGDTLFTIAAQKELTESRQ